jgi:hypothetical protein
MKKSAQIHTLAALPPQERPCFPLDGKHSGIKQSWYACWGEEKNLLLLLGIEPSFFSHPAYNPLLH